jgi:hypothetical protein
VALGNFLPYTPGSDTVILHKDNGAAVNTVAVQNGGCCGRMRAFWKIPELFNTGKFQNFSIFFHLPRSWPCHLWSSSLLVLCPQLFFSSPVLEALLEWFLWNSGLLHQRFFLDVLNRLKTSTYQCEFLLREQKDVCWCEIWRVQKLWDKCGLMPCENRE